jgi:hypothetical protein
MSNSDNSMEQTTANSSNSNSLVDTELLKIAEECSRSIETLMEIKAPKLLRSFIKFALAEYGVLVIERALRKR